MRTHCTSYRQTKRTMSKSCTYQEFNNAGKWTVEINFAPSVLNGNTDCDGTICIQHKALVDP